MRVVGLGAACTVARGRNLAKVDVVSTPTAVCLRSAVDDGLWSVALEDILRVEVCSSCEGDAQQSPCCWLCLLDGQLCCGVR
jgi:hypothetical protein